MNPAGKAAGNAGGAASAEPTDSMGVDLAARLHRLAAVTSELLTATGVSEVVDIVIGHLADAAGATVSSLSLLEDDQLRLVAVRGARKGVETRWARFPLAAATPAGDCLRAGRPLILTGRSAIRARYPDMELAKAGERTLVCLPLRGAGPGLGAVSLSFDGLRPIDDPELQFFTVSADACAEAIARIRAQEDAMLREERLRFLADASAELANSLDYEATLSSVARLAVPNFADWCVIQVLRDGQLLPLALAHPDSYTTERIRRLQEHYPPDPAAGHGAYQVARSGRSELIADVTDDMLMLAAQDPEHLAVLRELHFRSAIIAPLRVRDRVLGVISWVTGESPYRYDLGDLAFLEDLARRAAVAIDNAELHSQVRDVAMQLQRAVLPARLPQPSGWVVAGHYTAAGRTETGGDFYDVVSLPDGRIAVFVGDVMGRGVGAASTMAQMRSAVRTLIAQDPDPEAVLGGLDRLFGLLDSEQLVTVVLGLVDASGARLRLASAGHPAPLLVHADGSTDVLACDEPLILGVGGGRRPVTEVAVAPGETLLFFTDGLIERRGEGIDDGERRLVAALAGPFATDLAGDRAGEPAPGRPGDAALRLDAALGRLVAAVRDPERDDDVAVVALHRR